MRSQRSRKGPRCLDTWIGTPLGERPSVAYARLSESDPANTDNVTRQHRLIGEGIAPRFNVVASVSDNDRSASAHRNREREHFEELVVKVENGDVAVVLVTEWSRFCRDFIDLGRLVGIANRHGSLVVAWLTGSLDLGTSEGQMMAGHLTTQSAGESKVTSTRIRRARADARERGLTGCGSSAFGWYGKRHGKANSDGMTPHPKESKLVAQAIDRIVDEGWTFSDVTEDWIKRKVPTARGGVWDVARVRDILTNPRHAGYLVMPDGEMRKAQWPAIVDPKQYARLMAKVTRYKREQPRNARRMLTSLVCCTACGGVMSAHHISSEQFVGRYWKCLKRVGRDNCGATVIRAEVLEAYVMAYAFDLLRGRNVAGVKGARKAKAHDVHAQIAEVQRRYDNVVVRYNQGNVSDEAMDAADATYHATMSELNAEVHGVDADAERRALVKDGDRIIREWDTYSESERGRILRTFIERIDVDPKQRAHLGPKGESKEAALDRVHIVRRQPLG
jgi:DNA invertase Pin-like site-specific DNA recombinase